MLINKGEVKEIKKNINVRLGMDK